ncbi:beta-ketoadipyl CoA thiolase domain protein [Burkholderia thailandensis]|uniref:Beta-ketoadipyl CoA thiolase domain protein n=1 Tax=Burkholderia thailandensis TaxID=57975 RepID=A0AAW9D0K4_BURTH|nr:beta-ketoadipyl CoA thiolase domain protein [Burkholderia thailandensis]MDW9254793.1 beta-ketoadipyl CoA thiolase domain protein [Burkholderia thailandensis]
MLPARLLFSPAGETPLAEALIGREAGRAFARCDLRSARPISIADADAARQAVRRWRQRRLGEARRPARRADSRAARKIDPTSSKRSASGASAVRHACGSLASIHTAARACRPRSNRDARPSRAAPPARHGHAVTACARSAPS